MKKILASVTTITCIAAAGNTLAGMEAATGINGSFHDITFVTKSLGTGTPDSMGRVCVFCHTPHNATVRNNADQLPIWNHSLSTGTFSPYTWATPNNATLTDGTDFTIVDPLIGPSRLCLSCHDGSFAIDGHGQAASQAGYLTIGNLNTGMQTNAGRGNLTQDLSNTHPIGFDYNRVQQSRQTTSLHSDAAGNNEIVASSEGYATSITISNTAGTCNTVTHATTGKKISDNLYGGKVMTCASCHEVHNKENATNESYITGPKTVLSGNVRLEAPNYFLRAPLKDSLICLSCHVK